MAFNFPVFNPQVNQSSMVNLPPSDDFSESVVKGYEAGRVMGGAAQEVERIKLAAMEQRMQQESELHPLRIAEAKGQIAYQPVQQSKLVSDILGEPGTVTNMDTGPVVPVGTSPMALTQQFAAPEGGGQVPADTVSVGLPGQPGVGRSPSLRQQEKLAEEAAQDERWYKHRDYVIATSPANSKGAELKSVMERLSPEKQMQVVSIANTFKSRVLDKDATMLAVARAVDTGMTPDQIADEFVKSENPNLVRNSEFMDGLNQASVKLPINRKTEIATQLDNYLQPSESHALLIR